MGFLKKYVNFIDPLHIIHGKGKNNDPYGDGGGMQPQDIAARQPGYEGSKVQFDRSVSQSVDNIPYLFDQATKLDPSGQLTGDLINHTLDTLNSVLGNLGYRAALTALTAPKKRAKR